MKKLCWILFALLAVVRSEAQTITAAEYFFDTDPGAGLGTPIIIGTQASSVSFSANISTTSLSAGFHSLAIRAKDDSGKWGPSEWRTIYVSSLQTNVAPIVAAEYYFDTDPGPGNGTALGISTPGHAVQFSAVIPAATLQPGFHLLAVRTKDADGRWSFSEARGFYLFSQPINAQPITAAEYYIDNDPGAGNGTAVSVGSIGDRVNFIAAIPTTNLSSGFHRIAIRTRTADGIWGIVETSGFYIQPVSTAMGAITQAEYFLDTDPGVGAGAPLTITTPGNTVMQNFLITIPASTPNGQHLLAVRVKDGNGVWGLLEWREITVSGFPLPLDWLSFTARRKENTVALQWTTAIEVNTSHFDVERSVNGIEFTRMGQTTATGGVQNHYSYNEVSPAKGVN
ncbi:MAG TPA: hypothetical protein VER36_09535, partial [Flavisolibacter sp.]|nr:hypothetical protein [Flavisolibacter sp.]